MASGSAMAEAACDMSPEESQSLRQPEEAKAETPKQQRQPRRRRRRRRGSRRRQSFATYFCRVLKHLHTGLSLSQAAVCILESFVQDMFERIAGEASFLCRLRKGSTLRARDLHAAVRLLLPGQLATQARYEGKRAVRRCRRS